MIDSAFQLMVEQIANHRHAATHPLASTAKLGMTELGHRAIAVVEGHQHVCNCVRRQLVLLRKVVNYCVPSIERAATMRMLRKRSIVGEQRKRRQVSCRNNHLHARCRRRRASHKKL